MQSQATHLKMKRKKNILSSPAIWNQLVHMPTRNLPLCKVNGLQAPWQHPPHSSAHSLRHTVIANCTRSLLETRLCPYFPKTSQKPSHQAGAITIPIWADVLQEVKELHKAAQLVRCELGFELGQYDPRAAFSTFTACICPGSLKLEPTPLQCDHPESSPSLLAPRLPMYIHKKHGATAALAFQGRSHREYHFSPLWTSRKHS